ncbi:hypothetical protein PISL3812_06715 [Talaromyces islandicus]|uniref:Reverse transcriptase n=1 Tax=Talaromyces islandicus TaxID=28573 RepID=A0A0U1M3T0_TALIS|nr:hypothetical protein PISL3812_06715 [Talaromyces islandicus]
MSSTRGALPLTLKSISSTKVEELYKQRELFETRKAEILKAANAAPDHRAKARVLLEGVTRLMGYPKDAFDEDDDIDKDVVTKQQNSLPRARESMYTNTDWQRSENINMRRFLLQTRHDASVSDEVVQEWIASLEDNLRYHTVKYEHAKFYSDLVSEWLADLEEHPGEESLDKSSFEQVGRQEMHDQRATWESLVFSPAEVDSQAVETYLDKLFNRTKLSQQALKELRERIRDFGSHLRSDTKAFDITMLKTISSSLLRSDLLTPEKISILKEFLKNDEVAQEVADVLNLRFASIDRWEWASSGIPVEMRRHLNGKYRVFMDGDLIETVLLHYIGLEWSVEFRKVFTLFLQSPAWKSNSRKIPKEVTNRRKHFIENETPESNTVDYLRKQTYEADYFMTQLPRSLDEGKRSYDDDSDAAAQPGEDRMSSIETKQSLLHLLITESIVHNQLHGEFTVVRSDFKWFGPSLPHSTILTVLRFFGVQDDWLQFFKRFLECPLKFVHDGSEAKVQVRKRGVPMSHTISEVLGESILFCMDYAVNQHANGSFLYRLHDDFWFWGMEKTCQKAWKAMSDFTAVTGLQFNEEKTGTVRLGEKKNVSENPTKAGSPLSTDEQTSDESISESGSNTGSSADDDNYIALPQGDIRWGFLKLDPEQRRFLIDQDQVDTHVEELKRQLSSCKSIFAWIQAWNSYFARFFSNFFAKPSVAIGREHIDMVISTLSRIEREVFAGSGLENGNVADYLRKVIAERFDVHNLPDGFFFFPIELGGLEIHNPFIGFLAMREDVRKTPRRIMEKVFITEEANYEMAKRKWQKGDGYSRTLRYLDGPKSFFSLEEYTAHLESTSAALYQAYMELLRVPQEVEIGRTTALSRHQMMLSRSNRRKDRISNDWANMNSYWRWATVLYYSGMVKKYGSLSAVDRALMPLGVVKVLRQGKVRWQG